MLWTVSAKEPGGSRDGGVHWVHKGAYPEWVSPCPHSMRPLQLLLPRYSNLDLQSQEAYEMAVSGTIRPMSKSPMLISGIRCLHFAPPEFLLGKLSRKVKWGEGPPPQGQGWGITELQPALMGLTHASLMASLLPALPPGLATHRGQTGVLPDPPEQGLSFLGVSFPELPSS